MVDKEEDYNIAPRNDRNGITFVVYVETSIVV